MSKGRAWAIVAVVLVALIVALGVGLGLGLQKDEKETVVNEVVDCPPPRTSARLTKDSPIYVQPTNTTEGSYRFLSVAADSEICSKLGTETMIRHGGSAVDAAIVTVLCTGVYNTYGSGIGGGFFMTFYKRSEKKAYAVMAREMAPGGASQGMYIPADVSSKEGGMSIGIPGEIKGMYQAWKLGGSLPWRELFKPIIKMCTDGFKVGSVLHRESQKFKEYFDRYANLRKYHDQIEVSPGDIQFTQFTSFDIENSLDSELAYWAKMTNPSTGEYYKEGETIRFPKLANTLERIAEDPHTFYNGTLAEDISADIMEQAGIITTDDLKMYTAALKDPVSVELKGGYTVYSPPPPSSGAVLLFILNILNGFEFSKISIGKIDETVDTFHKVIESYKHGFAVRTNLGDSDQEDQAFKDEIEDLLQNMTSPDFAAARRARITDKVHPTDYYNPTYASGGSDAGTTHINVLGPNGDAVAITSTINLQFGSKIVGNRTGIIFNDEMDDFSTPGTVNYFGIPASPANFIKPYKRPLSSMSPTIVVDANGDVKLVTGASGGPRIITSTILSIIHTLWFELGVKEAIDYPRFHHQLVPETVRVEQRMPQAILDGLATRGHTFDIRDSTTSSLQTIFQVELGKIFASCDSYKFSNPDGA